MSLERGVRSSTGPTFLERRRNAFVQREGVVKRATVDDFRRLPLRDQQVLFDRYLNQDGIMSLEEIGEELGASRQRAKQLEERALQRLENPQAIQGRGRPRMSIEKEVLERFDGMSLTQMVWGVRRSSQEFSRYNPAIIKREALRHGIRIVKGKPGRKKAGATT